MNFFPTYTQTLKDFGRIAYNSPMKYLLLFEFMIGQMASATATKNYQIHFLGDQAVKRAVVQQIPSIFSRHVNDVRWRITGQGQAWIEVELHGETQNRINAWLYTIQGETQDSIVEIQEVH